MLKEILPTDARVKGVVQHANDYTNFDCILPNFPLSSVNNFVSGHALSIRILFYKATGSTSFCVVLLNTFGIPQILHSTFQ
jgi:hypothetical protein